MSAAFGKVTTMTFYFMRSGGRTLLFTVQNSADHVSCSITAAFDE